MALIAPRYSVLTFFILFSIIASSNGEAENETEYTCQTPNEWLPGYDGPPDQSENEIASELTPDVGHKFFREEKLGEQQLWPDATVYYKHSELSPLEDNHKYFLRQAIQEYREKTCIKFVESDHVTNYVTIILWKTENPKDCGKANVCMRLNGRQDLNITKDCMNKQTFVHELGHTLCLSHEHMRKDRDEFVSYETCSKPEGIGNSSYDNGIYDYASQMHYSCSCYGKGGIPTNPDWKLCGEYIPGNFGLSVMDADTLNQMYNCQQCRRHRWRPIAALTKKDKRNMYSFGHVNHNGTSIYPCRAMYRGEVAVGAYTHESNGCLIPSRFDLKAVMVVDRAEVLTIPRGLSVNSGDDEDARFQYQLVNFLSANREELFSKAVVAGNGWDKAVTKFARSFIAFTALTWHQYEEEVGPLDQSKMELPAFDNIGSAWEWGHGSNKYIETAFTTGKGNIIEKVDNSKILICK